MIYQFKISDFAQEPHIRAYLHHNRLPKLVGCKALAGPIWLNCITGSCALIEVI